MSASEGRLVLVPTPLGNREDLSPRALRTLAEADLVAAEDTRHTGRLLSDLGIKPRYLAFHEHNEDRQLPRLLEALAEGKRVALVSDAGTPGICDPGFRAVRAALAAGHAVEVLPGPAAVIPAVVGSGLPCDRFSFEGYLPRKPGARRAAFAALEGETRTAVFYETPHRLARSLAALAELMPERPVVVARELSKLHEEYWRGTAAELAASLAERPLKGEYVLVVGGEGAALPARRLP
ncbi:MAG: 16S rRNA (cytidine(1402)-2'-O)-methyltransferase [Candidatus Krumholzibacteriia bacterium]|nr:16S rRNA (cytidine(1402)-2'-O)-methyltransferase [bacterium]MCB9514047.1 16S rRNA (cytidine(1402)-2'-O)-methyltransferase [Candidatus Latescibacterota bacterium]MCB9515727.1 16S rRNA (cytidine(1402)-2'-O)-methyltransferase [Candidatus Latescibacterota bacterium]